MYKYYIHTSAKAKRFQQMPFLEKLSWQMLDDILLCWLGEQVETWINFCALNFLVTKILQVKTETMKKKSEFRARLDSSNSYQFPANLFRQLEWDTVCIINSRFWCRLRWFPYLVKNPNILKIGIKLCDHFVKSSTIIKYSNIFLSYVSGPHYWVVYGALWSIFPSHLVTLDRWHR
jgi:hypothetical protein